MYHLMFLNPEYQSYIRKTAQKEYHHVSYIKPYCSYVVNVFAAIPLTLKQFYATKSSDVSDIFECIIINMQIERCRVWNNCLTRIHCKNVSIMLIEMFQ